MIFAVKIFKFLLNSIRFLDSHSRYAQIDWAQYHFGKSQEFLGPKVVPAISANLRTKGPPLLG